MHRGSSAGAGWAGGLHSWTRADLYLGPEFQISEDTWEDHAGQGQLPGAAGEPGAGQDGFQGGDAGSLSMRDT